MRYLIGFVCVLALGVMGCSEGGGIVVECERDGDCDDDNDCTNDSCRDGVCEFQGVPDPAGPGEPGTTCGYYEGVCEGGSCTGVFACTEAGLREAIAAGAGPHGFDCDGPTTLVTEAEIVIDNDVILEGYEGLTIDGNETHRVFSVPEGTTAELQGFTITGGADANVGGIDNLGTLTVVNVTVSGNAGAGISNKGTLDMVGSTVADNTQVGVDSEGTLTLSGSTVDTVLGDSGPLTIINSTLESVLAGELTLRFSTVKDLGVPAESQAVLASSIIHGGCSCGTMTPANFVPIDCADVVTSDGYNIESPGDTCGLGADNSNQVQVRAADLKLGPLQDNGGPTETRALGEGSFAIDQIPADDCEVEPEPSLTPSKQGFVGPGETDQRGEPRPETEGTMCDVGAFERQPDDQ